jgi:uncharacterized membrane-anchored protein
MKKYFYIPLMFWALATLALADQNEEISKAKLMSLAKRIKYQEGQITIGNGLATLNLSESYRYVDPAGSETILTGLWGNPPSNQKTLGMIVPGNFDPFNGMAWCVVISYDEDGYVKDDDAEKINYDELLKEMQEGTKKASEMRVKEGYPSISLVGWAATPFYDRQTHKMYWAKEIKFGDQNEDNTLNYNLRLLGRSGVLVLNAVASIKQLQDIEKATPDILGMVNFNPGKRYSDYKPGVDKIATYGLAALVAGGVAAKTGFFKGLLMSILALKKFIIIAVVAVIAFIKKLFGKKK